VHAFLETLGSPRPEARDRAFRRLCQGLSLAELIEGYWALENYRRREENLYARVRATLFLHALCRYHLQEHPEVRREGTLPEDGFHDLLDRRFEPAIASFQKTLKEQGPNGAVYSALAEVYRHLAFQTLSDQVRRSVRASRGNQWMFRGGHAEEHPVRVRPELLDRSAGSLLYPILCERTPVRLDLSHSGWSDIFFLGMDFPEGARVLNLSVDLGVYGRDERPRPPVETYVRVLAEPLLRLTSVDLGATKDVTDLRDLFNFGNDYLSLLKAGVIASGLVPPSCEGTAQPLAAILAQVVGPGMGLELVTQVNDIPKGSRLAVSTSLLASIVSLLMRATGQTAALEGTLSESERRLAAARAILGEWLGGSGGGWQDSGGLWPGIKVICGVTAAPGDPEYGVSRGCLLPRHRVLDTGDLDPEIAARLAESLVLVHGGMAQNVGPILEMVTEKYLLREEAEWRARLEMRSIFDGILQTLASGSARDLAGLTTRNWDGPLKTIIPWVTNRFTETLIARARERFGADYWGFLMLGGMSGGGMALFVAPHRRAAFRDEVLRIMRAAKGELQDALPFAMDPVVYDFALNFTGSAARLVQGGEAVLPPRYYALQVPDLVRQKAEDIAYLRRAELDHVTASAGRPAETYQLLRTLVSSLFRVSQPASQQERMAWDAEAERLKRENGFDAVQHEQLREDLRAGRIGLARNRLPVNVTIENVREEDFRSGATARLEALGEHAARGAEALRGSRVAVLTLAGGVGSRWTTGAGVIKALSPFVQLAGRHRSFLEIHLAKTRKVAERSQAAIPHLVSTSFLTHAPIARELERSRPYGHAGPVYLSPGRSIAQRLVPMVRDLSFLWEERAQERLDERKEKVRGAARRALMDWARATGEGSDYVDNVPAQRFNPPGHWYELPNLLRNGVLARVLRENPRVETLMLHNIDSLGADLDPAALGWHLATGRTLTFEVVPRRIVDRGGGLARVNGRLRILEGLAQPRDEDELQLSHYNSQTTWIQLDPLLELFGLTRADLSGDAEKLAAAVRRFAQRLPTYVTIKDVKRRWGHGQEDVYPIAQFEKLWSDMTSLPEIACGYLAVPRQRGQQLKGPEELDPWSRDGSRDYVAGLCLLD